MAIFIESSTTSAIVVSSPEGSTSHYTHRLAIEILQSEYRKSPLGIAANCVPRHCNTNN